LKFNVPFWGLTYLYGRDDMYWFRLSNSLGKNSIVGTTVKSSENLPKNIAADEKHTKLKGTKVYVPITVGNNCILGAEVSKTANSVDLKKVMESLSLKLKI